uniref:Putative homeobox protein even skipped n=1 Tax=Schistosoma mansoni TaxID=6183 RepID=A0A3Q0KPJ8_SCHMA
MFPENIVNFHFPSSSSSSSSFLPYSSTFALFNELTTKFKHNSHITQNNSLQSTEINGSLSEKFYKDNRSSYSNSITNTSTNCSTDFDDTHTTTLNNNNNHYNNESKDTTDNIEQFSFKLENFGTIFKNSSLHKNSFIPSYCSIQKNNDLTNQQYPLHINNKQFNHHHSISWLDNPVIKLEREKGNNVIINNKSITNKQIIHPIMNLPKDSLMKDQEDIVKMEVEPSAPIMLEDGITMNEELSNESIHQLYLSNRNNHKSIEVNNNDNNADDIQEQSKRYRTSYSQKQIEVLEKTYQLDRYINRPQRAKLSIELDLPENKIKVWFQNRRMKEKRQALMLPTVAGKDPYLRETLLRVTQLYCATRYGNEFPIMDMKKSQSRVSQNKTIPGEIRKRIRTSFNPTTTMTTTVLSDKNSHHNGKSQSLSKKPWEKESNLITNSMNRFKDNFIHKKNEVNQSNINFSISLLNSTNEQILSRRHENEVVTSDISCENFNPKFQNNTEVSSDNMMDKNVDINKWAMISHPLNLSTSSVSSDESHSLVEDQSIQTKQNFPNLFSTFPFIHSTSSAMLDYHNESVISSTTSQMNSF